MFPILKTEELAPRIKRFRIRAPKIAEKVGPDQFLILRINDGGERIPLTVSGSDKEEGIVEFVFQEIGKTTYHLGSLKAGDFILDVVGPLGVPLHAELYGTVVCVGGGVGIAPLPPIVKAMKEAGNKVISILGAKTRDLLILEEEIKQYSDAIIIATDDGSYGRKGFVTEELTRLIRDGIDIDLVIAVGPAIMMKAVSEITRQKSIRTLVSLNSIMVDGTGMCGACRVSVGGHTRFVCVEGPEFDGHQVDFNELIQRQRMYLQEEKESLERYLAQKEHKCDLDGR